MCLSIIEWLCRGQLTSSFCTSAFQPEHFSKWFLLYLCAFHVWVWKLQISAFHVEHNRGGISKSRSNPFSFLRCSMKAQCSSCHLMASRYFAFCCIMPQPAPGGVYLTGAAPCWYAPQSTSLCVLFYFLNVPLLQDVVLHAALWCAHAIYPTGGEFKSIWPQGNRAYLVHLLYFIRLLLALALS